MDYSERRNQCHQLLDQTRPFESALSVLSGYKIRYVKSFSSSSFKKKMHGSWNIASSSVSNIGSLKILHHGWVNGWALGLVAILSVGNGLRRGLPSRYE